MNYITSIGLDVHARSVTGAAFNPLTGEITTRTFGYSPVEIASWVLSFESPKAVYESGVTGFDLCRELRELGVDCIIGAVSKMQKPSADAKRKNDASDAEFLARLLSTHNIVEVFVPDKATEAARDLVRAHDDCRTNLTRARQRLSFFLMRHGRVFNERSANGTPIGYWTRAHWAWIRGIRFGEENDEDVLAFYISEVRHLEAQKKQIENWIAHEAKADRWRSRVDALRCLKGIETLTAFALVVEAGVFSRFDSARAFASWTGLIPSENSSGQRKSQGGVSKTGNAFVRRLLVESAWHYPRASTKRKQAPTPEVPLAIENHAAKATKRLVSRRKKMMALKKKSVVANCATARELACWVWAIGCMAEGALV